MRITFFVALCVAVMAQGTAVSGEFPSKATYLFYIQGKSAGKSDIAITEEGGAVVFTSVMEVALGDFPHALSCRTEYDKKTLRPRLFRYKGTRDGGSLSGTVSVKGDSVRGDLEVRGASYSAHARWADPTVIFQNFVPEHLLMVTRHLEASTEQFIRFNLLFPTEMMTVPGIATVESEIEVPTRPAPVVCKKYSVSFQNSAPFYLYVDVKRHLPVYMDFPSSATETFLESAYGAQPPTKYRAVEGSETGP